MNFTITGSDGSWLDEAGLFIGPISGGDYEDEEMSVSLVEEITDPRRVTDELGTVTDSMEYGSHLTNQYVDQSEVQCFPSELNWNRTCCFESVGLRESCKFSSIGGNWRF